MDITFGKVVGIIIIVIVILIAIWFVLKAIGADGVITNTVMGWIKSV